jgi:hypothetical protein
MVQSTASYPLDDEFDFDSPYWDNIPDELWDGLNGQYISGLCVRINIWIDIQSTVAEASASNIQLEKSYQKRPPQFHDGERET